MAYLTQYSGSVPIIKFTIDQSHMNIGQHMDMDICVPEDGVSDNHAAIEAIKQAESYKFVVKSREDEPLLDVNGEILSYAELKDGDWIIIGGVEFKFTDDGAYDIKEVEVPALVKAVAEKIPPQTLKKTKESDALTLMKELKQEVESITTKSDKFIEESRFSRRLSLF